LADFNKFLHATLKKLTQITLVWPPHFNTDATLRCEMQKS